MLIVAGPFAEEVQISACQLSLSQLSNLLGLTTGETEKRLFAQGEFFIQAQSEISTVAV